MHFDLVNTLVLTLTQIKAQANKKKIKLVLQFENQFGAGKRGELPTLHEQIINPNQMSSMSLVNSPNFTMNFSDELKFIQQLFGDKRRISQVITNFLTNALKFTE